MSSEIEYVCPDCGCLLIHSNPLTLESMMEVHNQLCVVKRQNSMASQVANRASAPPKAVTTGVQRPGVTSPTPSIATTATTAGSANTTISLSGTGTNYS
ncbi:MAG: hypothetical protein WBE34_00975, partial [Candidatus Nitrosopolaris sp.]